MSLSKQHSFIPADKIKEHPEDKSQTEKNNIFKKDLYNLYPVIGDVSPPANLAEAFDIHRLEEHGITLFISNRNYLRETANTVLPRAFALTDEGRGLSRKYPGVFSQIEDNKLSERIPQIYGFKDVSYSGKVRICSLGNEGDTVAVKRFYRKRGTDGYKARVGGLEQLEAYIRVNEYASLLEASVRSPKIYFASQDVIVMENLEKYSNAAELVENNPKLYPIIQADCAVFGILLSVATTKGAIKGEIDFATKGERCVGVPIRNLFVENPNDSPENFKYVLIDPNY